VSGYGCCRTGGSVACNYYIGFFTPVLCECMFCGNFSSPSLI
jgi:hypothetical protein